MNKYAKKWYVVVREVTKEDVAKVLKEPVNEIEEEYMNILTDQIAGNYEADFQYYLKNAIEAIKENLGIYRDK